MATKKEKEARAAKKAEVNLQEVEAMADKLAAEEEGKDA